MIPGMDMRQLKMMMQQMGIKSKEVSAKRVVIEKEEGNIIITSPQIVEIEMGGQKSYQIMGRMEEEAGIKEEDIKLVMEQANCSRADAEKALKETDGDIAEAIMKLKG